MRGLRRKTLTALVAMASVGLVAPVVADQAAAFTGVFSGTGRACQGSLAIRKKTISWVTPFSQCKNLPYEVLEQGNGKAGDFFTFRLKGTGSSCRYTVLHLTHEKNANGDIGWNVIGYLSQQSYAKDKEKGFKAEEQEALSCYLTTKAR